MLLRICVPRSFTCRNIGTGLPGVAALGHCGGHAVVGFED